MRSTARRPAKNAADDNQNFQEPNGFKSAASFFLEVADVVREGGGVLSRIEQVASLRIPSCATSPGGGP